VLLALVLWLFIRSESGLIKIFKANVEVQVQPHMEISNDRPISVEVTMRGPASSNMYINQSPPVCIINLQNAKEGEQAVTLTTDNIKAPKGSGYEILQVNPNRVVLKLERTISKEVPINVPIRGHVAGGFEIFRKILNPSTVVVTGPRSHIESIKEVSTEAITLNGQSSRPIFWQTSDSRTVGSELRCRIRFR